MLLNDQELKNLRVFVETGAKVQSQEKPLEESIAIQVCAAELLKKIASADAPPDPPKA